MVPGAAQAMEPLQWVGTLGVEMLRGIWAGREVLDRVRLALLTRGEVRMVRRAVLRREWAMRAMWRRFCNREMYCGERVFREYAAARIWEDRLAVEVYGSARDPLIVQSGNEMTA